MAQRGARRDPSKERLWRRLLRLFRRSGRTVREFCAEHEVSQPSFFAWRRTIAERDQQRRRRDDPNCMASAEPLPKADEQPAFVPLRVVSTAACMAFEVVLSDGRVVRVSAGFEAASLRRLLAVLEEERPC
jgi:transposase-like protein